ncbi:MAG: alpha-amylase family protein [Inquilinaceae bacterium]
MAPPDWIAGEARRTLDRLTPRILTAFDGDVAAWEVFRPRLERHFERLFAELLPLYGGRYDFFWHLEQILLTAARSWLGRPARLRRLDGDAESDPVWFQSHTQLGAVCYVDLFAGDLDGIRARIPYLQDLGITYLHLMPLLKAREGENDGGYAVASYREVEPALGTMDGLEDLAETLRGAGIRLCLDFVFNHTADTHEWAEAAKRGDPDRQDYYRMYPDRTEPDRYRPTLREIFPDHGGDPFQFVPEVGKWVWSTFYPYQWDLNFASPALFRQMLEEMLFLANRGVEVLRLDAVPFIWKEAGTNCENLPGVHHLIRAYNALAAMAAPALTFKSEAIVHPDEVARYVGPDEAPLSYHPLLMVLLWEALATRDTALLRHSMIKRFAIPPGSGWVNYVRGHDDIGWGFADEDCAEVGIDPTGHRAFLNTFYTGRFPGSFAAGLPFQENPRTGDCRICGTTASLAGLEKAVAAGDRYAIDLAVARILLLHGLILTVGGLPLIYLGDEVALENDYGFRADPVKAPDARWTHRRRTDWAAQEAVRADPSSPGGRVFAGLKRLIALRKDQPALAGREMDVLPLANGHVFAFRRSHEGPPLVILANMTERAQPVADAGLTALVGKAPWTDLAGGPDLDFGPDGAVLDPYRLCVLKAPG